MAWGTPFVPHSSDEVNTFGNKYLVATNYKDSGNCWIGLNDVVTEGSPQWIDGTGKYTCID